MTSRRIICFLLFTAVPLFGQAGVDLHPGGGNGAAADPWAQLAITTLTFTHAAELSGLPQSPFIVTPPQCTPNGDLFFQVPLPPKFMTRAFVTVNPAGKTSVNTQAASVPGFENFRQGAVFPGEHYVYELVEGRYRSPDKPATDPGENPPWGEFIAQYLADGAIKSIIPLTHISRTFIPMAFAVLRSGRFVVVGKDFTNLAPEAVMLDRTGAKPQPLDLFGSEYYSIPELSRFYPEVNHDNPAGTGLDRVLSYVQFVSYGENVLLVERGTNFPLVEIGDAGILRTIPLQLPAGTTIESLLPSSQNLLYVRIADARANPAAHRLIVFDSGSGEALREIKVSGILSPGLIACEAHHTFLALGKTFRKGDSNGAWTLMIASE